MAGPTGSGPLLHMIPAANFFSKFFLRWDFFSGRDNFVNRKNFPGAWILKKWIGKIFFFNFFPNLLPPSCATSPPVGDGAQCETSTENLINSSNRGFIPVIRRNRNRGCPRGGGEVRMVHQDHEDESPESVRDPIPYSCQQWITDGKRGTLQPQKSPYILVQIRASTGNPSRVKYLSRVK